MHQVSRAGPHAPAKRPGAAASGPVSNAILRVTRLHIARARQLFRAVGVHPGQELLLMHLWDDGPQRQTDLAATFDTDSASMTRSVQRLERAGFVRRTRDPSDGRATLVSSTPAGTALRTRIEETWAQLERDTTADISASRLRVLLRELADIETNLYRATQGDRSQAL
jgi:DNA-binding MarR family transcriptional regulator